MKKSKSNLIKKSTVCNFGVSKLATKENNLNNIDCFVLIQKQFNSLQTIFLKLNIFLLKIIYAPFKYKLILWLIFYFIKVIFIQQGTFCSNMSNGMPVPEEALSDYESNSDSEDSYTVYGYPTFFTEDGFPKEDVIISYGCVNNPNVTAYAYFSRMINACHMDEVRRFILDGNIFENHQPTRSVMRVSRFIQTPVYRLVINRVHGPQHQVFTVNHNPFDQLINSYVRGYPTHVSDIATTLYTDENA